jgi:hypothetical protein
MKFGEIHILYHTGLTNYQFDQLRKFDKLVRQFVSILWCTII